MYNKLYRTSLIVLLAWLWLMPVVAAQTHGEHEAPATAPACEQPAALACAATATPVFDRQGRLWVAWSAGGHVYVSHSADQGRSFNAPVAVNRVPAKISARGENRPKLAFGPQAQIYVSWTEPLEKRFTGRLQFSRSLDGGRSFSEPALVYSEGEVVSQRFDALAAAEDGTLYLFWLDKRDLEAARAAGQDYRGAAIYYAVSRDQGASFEAERKLADHSCECCRIALALEQGRRPVVIWRHIYEVNTRDHAMARFTTTGTPERIWRLSHDQWQVDGCPHHGPALSISTQGVYHAAWYNNAPQRQGLFYSHSLDQGQSFAAPFSFGRYAQNAAHPAVLSLGRQVYLAWREFDGEISSVWLMQSTDQGQSWGTPRQLAQTRGEADYPVLITDQGKPYLAWLNSTAGLRVIPLEAE